MKEKVLVAVSGGVDSSVAALLLKDAGYTVAGVTMCLGIRKDGDMTRYCGQDAIEDARQVCEGLQIPHHILDYAGEMEEKVIEKFTAAYLQGRTPNPCIDCNRHLKFGALLEKARAMGFDYLATGHYARIEKRGDRRCLLKAKDPLKDQTYFLYPIRCKDLASILFPLGGLTKTEVRTLARKAGLPVAHREESQDICFVTQGDYRQFILERTGPVPPGDIVDLEGTVLGRHRGILFYTIGQRSGLGISARTSLYVIGIDATANRIVVGGKEHLQARGLLAGDLNLFSEDLPLEVEAKIRYRKKPARCRISKEENGLRVIFDEAQESITPGQAIVFYEDAEVLGGGVIEQVIHDTD